MRRAESQRPILWRRFRRLAAVSVCIALTAPLAGCLIPNDIIPAAIDIPPAYRDGPRQPDAALPSVVWWRGFGSKELTDLIEEALTSNFDIAAAVARIVPADAERPRRLQRALLVGGRRQRADDRAARRRPEPARRADRGVGPAPARRP